MNIKVKEMSTGVFMVELFGPLDTYNHEIFNMKMESLETASAKAIILDMAGVDYISSMGIGSIFKVRKYAKENKVEFAVLNLQPQVKKVFDAVQAMPKEAIFSSMEEIDAYLDHLQKDNG